MVADHHTINKWIYSKKCPKIGKVGLSILILEFDVATTGCLLKTNDIAIQNFYET